MLLSFSRHCDFRLLRTLYGSGICGGRHNVVCHCGLTTENSNSANKKTKTQTASLRMTYINKRPNKTTASADTPCVRWCACMEGLRPFRDMCNTQQPTRPFQSVCVWMQDSEWSHSYTIKKNTSVCN
eukprot:scpid49120/ scgid31783/ 